MGPITRNHIQEGRMFSNGGNIIYEILKYVRTSEKLNGKTIEFILAKVTRLDKKKGFIHIENKEIEFRDLKPIPNKIEYSRVHAYNR